MRQLLPYPGSAGRKPLALVCLLAVVLLWSPLWAAAWQAYHMDCCNGRLCPAHSRTARTVPTKPQTTSEECEHHGGNSQPSGNMHCSMTCCHEAPVSFTSSTLFLVPQPAALSQPAELVAGVSLLAPSGLFHSLEPLSPPPRATHL